MKLFDLIEQVKLDIGNVNQAQSYLIHDAFEPDQWVHAGGQFLRGISATSRMPSEVFVTLRGIQDYYGEHHTITRKQSFYIMHAILDYWSEISLEIRCCLVNA